MEYSKVPKTAKYREFEPVFELIEEENLETLIIYLPDFKIEDIRVQIDSQNNLLVGGVRRQGQNEWVRFTKNFKIPSDCNADEIKANFSNEALQISMPKKLITKVAPEKQKPPETIQEPPAIPKTEEGELKQRKRVEEEVERREPTAMKDEKDDAKKKEDKLFPDSKTEMKEKEKVGNGTLGLGVDKPKELLVNVVVALMVLLGLGIYVTFKMRKS